MQESAAVSGGDHKVASNQPINDSKATEVNEIIEGERRGPWSAWPQRLVRGHRCGLASTC